MPLTRRPGFWIAYVVLAAVALFVALELFPSAIPVVHLDIRMPRHQAEEAAQAFAREHDLAPPDARAAVRFAHDETLQNYVELEGGGKRAFAQLIESGAYAPYGWEVRLFAPGVIDEVLVRFRPDGTPYGFERKVPETWLPQDASRRALSPDEARAIAERDAASSAGIDFSRLRRLDETQVRRPNGRVDHAFVYERTDATAGEARFRVRLGVAGDQLREVTHFAFVPESFERRFTLLRATNNTIANSATLAAGVLYGLGGCVLGVLWLMRQHGLLWRPAFAAGLVVGALLGLAGLAASPTAWFGYDTAEPVATFWLREIGGAVLLLFGGGVAYGFVFMAAESLSRRAFPHHPQLWKLWRKDAAATPQVLGRTAGGYLFVAFELAFVALFYYATNRWLGWWQPSEALTDPNILGSAVPALSPISLSLQAGLMEESLFRAVPLSLAALIGARFGRRGLAVAIAAVLQALIFGGAHANYPGFPAYSRLAELIVPSLIWAVLFLRYGLLVTILLHALFDLALMSIPLFLVDAPGAGLQRGLVILAGLVPLLVVLVQRWRQGAWREFPEALRNAAWRYVAPATPEESRAVPADRPVARWIHALHRILPIAGAVGLLLWLGTTPFRSDVPALTVSRAKAIRLADAALEARGVRLDAVWQRSARVRLPLQEGSQSEFHEYVWREGGPGLYARLIGNTLAPPLWEVRFARFTGDVADRAEEWRVTVQGNGRIRQIRHALPEARPGARLDRDAALALALRAVREQLDTDPAELRLIGADQKEEPARRDWTFLFANPAVVVGDGGEGRVQVAVAGDEVVNAGRYIHVPEEWERTQREREGRLTFAKLALAAFTGVALIGGLVFAARRWMHREYDRGALRYVAALSFALAVAGLSNTWPEMLASLSTSEPVTTQVAMTVVSRVFAALFAALALGFVSAIGAWAARQRPPATFAGRPAWAGGVAAALIVAGLGAGLSALAPHSAPIWPAYALAGQALPPLGALLAGAGSIGAIGGALFVLAWLEHLTRGWQRHLWLAGAVLLLALATVAVVGAANPLDALIGGCIAGGAAIVVVYGVLRFDLRTVPAYITTGLVLGMIESAAHNATVPSYVNAVLGIGAAIAMTILIMRYLARPPEPAATS